MSEYEHELQELEIWLADGPYSTEILARFEAMLNECATLKREKEALENEIYDAIFYEPHKTDSWGKLTNKQLMALNNIGRRLTYKRQERVLLTGGEDETE